MRSQRVGHDLANDQWYHLQYWTGIENGTKRENKVVKIRLKANLQTKESPL